MKLPRLRIADAMLLIALVAADITARRTPPRYILWAAGVLPMIHILAIALMIRLRRRSPFLDGSLAFGALGLTYYAAIEDLLPSVALDLYLLPCFELLWETVRVPHADAGVVNNITIVMLLTLPQLGVATLGGLLWRVLPAPTRKYAVLACASACVLATVPFALEQCRLGKVTACNCRRVALGMAEAEAVVILGPGEEVKETQLPIEIRFSEMHDRVVNSDAGRDPWEREPVTYRVWRNAERSRWLWIGIREGKIVEQHDLTRSSHDHIEWDLGWIHSP